MFQKAKKSFQGFFFAPFDQENIQKAPWKTSDGVKMVLFSSLFLFLISWGGFFLGVLLTDTLTMSTLLIEHFTFFIAMGLILQVLGQLFFLFLFSFKKYQISWQDFGFKKISLKKTLTVASMVFLVGLLMQNGLVAGMEAIGIAPVSADSGMETIIHDKILPFWSVFLFVVIIAPLMEETIFRGFLLKSFFGKFNPWWAIAFSSLLFAAAHLSFTLLPLYFLMGVLLALVYLRTGSLWPGITFHAINNLAALLILI